MNVGVVMRANQSLQTYMVKFYRSLLMKKACVSLLGKQPTVKAVFILTMAENGREREIINENLLYVPGEIILVLGVWGKCLKKLWRKIELFFVLP